MTIFCSLSLSSADVTVKRYKTSTPNPLKFSPEHPDLLSSFIHLYIHIHCSSVLHTFILLHTNVPFTGSLVILSGKCLVFDKIELLQGRCGLRGVKKGEGGGRRRRRGQIKSKGDFQGIYGLETPE